MTTAYMAKLARVKAVASRMKERLRGMDVVRSPEDGGRRTAEAGRQATGTQCQGVSRDRDGGEDHREDGVCCTPVQVVRDGCREGAKTVEARPPARVAMVRARMRSGPHQRVRAANAGG